MPRPAHETASPSSRCPPTAAGGTVSRIVPALQPGAGVVTTRGHAQWVVTEYGAVDLHGMTLRERGEALISIAHPDFRPELQRNLNAIRQRRAGASNGFDLPEISLDSRICI